MYLAINLIVFFALLFFLAQLFHVKNDWSLSKRVFIALIIGVIFGTILQLSYGAHSEIIANSIQWVEIVGNGYILLLQMIIMPLVFISILSAVVKLNQASSLGKISALVISILLFTTMLSAIVGIAITLIFNLSAEGLIQGTKEIARLQVIEQSKNSLDSMTIPQMILSFIPKNPFFDLTGQRSTSIIAVVIFAVFLGIAVIQFFKEDKEESIEKGNKIINGIELIQAWITRLVRIVMKLTPFGVFALMTKMVASSNLQEILKLAEFVVASYLALAIMFIVHALLVSLTGINPITFFQKIGSLLLFAFTSRSSAASIPLNIETQNQQFNVPTSIASFASSFGATIGQNGCAGIYPAMLATMTAPTMGINPFDLTWILTLIAITTISSIGVAGVGGGATFAALIVLPLMGLPIELIALLITVEPLIDMGRTALNVSGSATAGIITSKILNEP